MSDERSGSFMHVGPVGSTPEELLLTPGIPVNDVKFHYQEHHEEWIPVRAKGEIRLNVNVDWMGFMEAVRICTRAMKNLRRAHGGPRPLKIDGHEYRRRQRNRRR